MRLYFHVLTGKESEEKRKRSGRSITGDTDADEVDLQSRDIVIVMNSVEVDA